MARQQQDRQLPWVRRAEKVKRRSQMKVSGASVRLLGRLSYQKAKGQS